MLSFVYIGLACIFLIPTTAVCGSELSLDEYFKIKEKIENPQNIKMVKESNEKNEKDSSITLIKTTPSLYWDKIETYRNTKSPFVQEKYLNKSRHENEEIVSAFGDKFPKTSDFLLHYAKNWNTNTGKVVILIHGASDNATRAWILPESLQGNMSVRGLVDDLVSSNFRVFAITFPHKHGNLFYEAQHLASAIKIVKNVTGTEKVVLIGHSAGGVVARLYLTDFRLSGNWDKYGNDVETLITLASPHGGQDYIFRHTEMNYFYMQDEMLANAPTSWDKILYYGVWIDTYKFSIYDQYFPMQQQLLANLTGIHPIKMTSPDYYTTLYGGQGFVSHSLGINEAIQRGGNFINNLKKYPLPPDVNVILIAGTKQELPNIPDNVIEKDGPSDGLIFISSALDTQGMNHPSRTKPIKTITVNENHVSITYSPSMKKLIIDLIR